MVGVAVILGISTLVLFGSVALTPAGSSATTPIVVGGCIPVFRGLDLRHATRGEAAGLGKSLAQVFYAGDTVVTSVTVWRVASQTLNLVPMHLFITTADSANAPPNPHVLLLDGPTIVLTETGPALPVRFNIDPPLHLPGPGFYSVVIKDDDQDCLGFFALVADSTDSYPQGGLWYLSPIANCTGPGRAPESYDREDLIFEVEFCVPADPALRSSWGRVKAEYR
jgi:hypothetical protein